MTTFFTMHADANFLLESGLVTGMSGLEIHFDFNVGDREWMRLTSPPRPSLLTTRRITGYIRSDGRMYDTPAVSAIPYDVEDPGELGVRLPANDPDLNLSNDVTYYVSGEGEFDGRPWSFYPFYTPAVPSTDTSVELASFYPGPGQTVVGIPQLGLLDHLDDVSAIGKLLGRAVSEDSARAAIAAQQSSAELTGLAALTGADKIAYRNASGGWAAGDLSPYARTVIAADDNEAARAALHTDITTFYDDFTTKPNGTLLAGAVSDSGHTYTVLGQIPWAVSAGRLTHTQTNNATAQSSYLGVNLGTMTGDEVGYMWAEYEVPEGADPQESIVLISGASEFTVPGYGFANSAAHCTFTGSTMRYDKYQVGSGALVKGRGQYPELTPGIYRIEITLSGKQATITGPDGTQWRSDVDADIANWAGPWATLQLYNDGDGSNNKALKVLRWGAELKRRARRGPYASASDVAKVATRPGRLLGQMQTSANNVATAITTSLSAKLFGLTIPIPPSRRIFIEGTAWFDEYVPPIRTRSQLALGVYPAGVTGYGFLTTVHAGYTPANAMTAYTVSVTGGAGTWAFTVGANSTTALAWNASAATVQSAIETLANVGVGNVTVTLSGTTYTVLLSPTLSASAVSAAGSGGATAAASATYLTGRLHAFALNLTLDPAFEIGAAVDMQAKAQANDANLFQFVESGSGSGFDGIRRSSMKIFEAA